MGIFGGGDRRSTTTQTTNVDNTSIGFENIEGPAIAGSNNQITLTDAGLVSAAESIARESILGSADQSRQAFTLVRDLGEASLDFGGRALETVDRSSAASFDFAGNALDFAGGTVLDALTAADKASSRALDFADRAGVRQADTFADALQFADAASSRDSEVLADSLAFGERSLSSSSSFAKELFGTSLEAVTGVLKEGQAQLGNTVSNLNAIARQQSTSSDERIQQIATSALKYGAIGLGLLAAGFLAMRYTR